MVRPSKSLRVILAALLFTGALAIGTPQVHAAPRPNPPTTPGTPRSGDPDMPEWSNRGGDPEKTADVLFGTTIWHFLRAMFARDEA